MSRSPPLPGLDSPPPRLPLLHTPVRPARPQASLFFSPAETDVPAVYTRTARGADDDDDDEDEDEAPASKRQRPASPSSRQRPASPSNRQRPTTTSTTNSRRPVNPAQNQSSALALFDDLGGGPAGGATFDPLMGPVGMMADDDDAVGTSTGEAGKRRVMPKMDVERLLGDRGFPALINDAKRFRVRGKGHEGKDLANLLSMYQLWAHQMYPKMTFGDTVTKVEALCGTNVAKSALRGYRERDREIKEALFRSPTPPPLSSQQQQAVGTPSEMTGVRATNTAAVGDRLPDPLPLSGPSHHGRNEAEEEEEDYEAMIAAAEAEAEEAHRALAATRTGAGTGTSSSIAAVGREENQVVGDNNDDDDDGFPPPDFEHELEMAMAVDAPPAPAAARTSAVGHAQGREDEYEDDWAAMDGL